MTKPDNPPAFPFNEEGESSFSGQRVVQTHPGMELRDWFAGQALAGMLANGQGPNTHWLNGPSSDVASHAYDIANAMLAERTKPNG